MSFCNDWSLVSSHGIVLFYIACRPGCTVDDIAEALFLTPRTVWNLAGDLRRAGMLQIQREGHRHRYNVNLDASFVVRAVGEFPFDMLLGKLADGYVEA
jgi:predicted transcriptional regulator